VTRRTAPRDWKERTGPWPGDRVVLMRPRAGTKPELAPRAGVHTRAREGRLARLFTAAEASPILVRAQQEWAWHHSNADYWKEATAFEIWRLGWIRWLNLAWGVVHAWVLVPVGHCVLRATSTVPRAAATALAITALTLLLHLTFAVTIVMGGHAATLVL
jgi:hypothetical protein